MHNFFDGLGLPDMSISPEAMESLGENSLMGRISQIEESIIRINALIQAIINTSYDNDSFLLLQSEYQRLISSHHMKAASVNQSNPGGQL